MRLRSRRIQGVVAAVVACGGIWAGSASATTTTTPPIPTWVTDGTVDSIATVGNTAYVGGTFDCLGPDTGSGAVLSSSTAQPETPYSKIIGAVYASVPDGSGGYYVGGDFAAAGGLPRSELAHIEADGAVDPKFVPKQPNGRISALALSGSTLYVGGAFTQIGFAKRSHIAAVNAVNGQLTSWNPNASGAVFALSVDGSRVFAGGGFSTIGGQSRAAVAALDIGTGKATAWNAGMTEFESVDAIAISGARVYIGGEFNSVGGEPRNAVAALDAATGQVTSWAPNQGYTTLAGQVTSLAVSGAAVWVGTSSSSSTTTLAAFDRATGMTTPTSPDVVGSVDALSLEGSTLYVGGAMSTLDGQPIGGLAAIGADTGLPAAWGASLPANRGVFALSASGSTVFAGGQFNTVDCVGRKALAAIDLTTGEATAWDPQVTNEDPRIPSGTVSTVVVDGSTMYVGGQFATIEGQARNGLAAIDLTTGQLTPWNPAPSGSFVRVKTIAPDGQTIYVGGVFTQIGGQARNGVAALDAASGQATDWNPGASQTEVDTIVPSGAVVYVGGGFTAIGGQSRNGIAAIDPGTGGATAWNPNPGYGRNPPQDQSIDTIAVNGSTVYVGGSFTQLGGQTRRGIGAVSASTGKATSWNPNATDNTTVANTPGSVDAIALTPAAIYIGGTFSSIAGAARTDVAALAPTGGARALSWNPAPNAVPIPAESRTVLATVHTIVPTASTILIGGAFPALGEDAQDGFAELPAP